MKFFKSVFIHAVIFTLALFVVGMELPKVDGSEVLGVILSASTFTIFGGLFTLFSALGGIILGAIAGVIVGGEDGGKLGGCFGLLVGFVVGYFLDVWLVGVLPAHLAWFPVFQSTHIYAMVAVIWLVDFATADYSKLKNKES